MREISWLAENRLASQTCLYSTQLVSQLVICPERVSSVGNDSKDLIFVVVIITRCLNFIHQIHDFETGSVSLLPVSGCTCSVSQRPTKLFSVTGPSPSVGHRSVSKSCSTLSPKDRNRSSFRNNLFCLNTRTLTKPRHQVIQRVIYMSLQVCCKYHFSGTLNSIVQFWQRGEGAQLY